MVVNPRPKFELGQVVYTKLAGKPYIIGAIMGGEGIKKHYGATNGWVYRLKGQGSDSFSEEAFVTNEEEVAQAQAAAKEAAKEAALAKIAELREKITMIKFESGVSD